MKKHTKPDRTKFTGNKIKEKLMILRKSTKDLKSSHVLGLTMLLFILFLTYPNVVKSNNIVGYESIKQAEDVKISFTGDVSPSRYVLESFNESFKPKDLYTDIKTIWEDSDISLINLEAVPLKKEPSEYKQISANVKLHTDVENIKAIKEAGIDLLALANNHMGDFGRLGMIDAMDLLDEEDIDYIGLGHDQDKSQIGFLKDINGKKIGIQNITDVFPKSGPLSAGTNLPGAFSTKHINYLSALENNFKEADYNIVIIHWGNEHTIRPNDDVRELARQLIDLGADLVIGSHPHVLHPVEKYKGGAIVYSMGNTVFDQVVSSTNKSAIGSIYIKEDGSEVLEFVPMYIFEGRPVKTDKQTYVNEIFRDLTKYLDKDDYYIENNRLYIKLD